MERGLGAHQGQYKHRDVETIELRIFIILFGGL